MTVKLLRKWNKQLTLGRKILKDPRSRLALGQRVLRPMLVVSKVVCDMDKGTICEFGKASAHDMVEVE